jgi:hypothetical protein
MNMDQPIPISLSRAQWEHVLTMLARQPFNEVAGLIAEVQRQSTMHEMRQRAGQPPPPRLVPEDYGPIDQVAE